MKSLLASILLLHCALCLVNLDGVQSFSIPSKSTAVGNAATSALFRPSRQARRQPASISFSPMTQLKMTDEKDDGKEVEASTETNDSANIEEKTVKKPKERSGFWTALILAPPLIAKFGIVLIVKVITDLIVFPLLFLFRIGKTAKNKIVGLFRNDDILNGDSVNGN